MDKKAIEIKRN